MLNIQEREIFEFGRALGWKLKKHVRTDFAEIDRLIWYDVGDVENLCFQINTTPNLRGCVFNLPNSICTCWHEIDSDNLLTSELEHFIPFWSKEEFSNKNAIDRFKIKFPRFVGFDMKSLEVEIPDTVTFLNDR